VDIGAERCPQFLAAVSYRIKMLYLLVDRQLLGSRHGQLDIHKPPADYPILGQQRTWRDLFDHLSAMESNAWKMVRFFRLAFSVLASTKG
jgi:hypothetical protein